MLLLWLVPLLFIGSVTITIIYNWELTDQAWASQMAVVVKNLQETWDTGLIPESGRSPGEGHGNPLQYSCLENPMDRGAWWATVHSVAKSWTWLTRLSTHPDHYKELGFYSFQNTNICRVLRRYKPSVVYQSVSRHKLIYAELGGIREEVAQVISTHLMTGGLWAMCQKNMKMWIALGRQRWGKIARRTAKK